MNSEYIDQRNGGYYVAGTRISLDSVVCAFNRGESPEKILEAYPLLGNLARVYGAINLENARREFGAGSVPLAEENSELWERLRRVGHESGDFRPGSDFRLTRTSITESCSPFGERSPR